MHTNAFHASDGIADHVACAGQRAGAGRWRLLPLVAAVVFCAAVVGLTSARAGEATSSSASGEAQHFAIGAQALAGALRAYADQTGEQIVFFSEVGKDQRSAEVVGSYTRDEALAKILEHTGLKFERLNSHTIVIMGAQSTAAEVGNRLSNTSLRLATGGAAIEESDGHSPAASPTTEQRGADTALEEVVVTAQKREERLIDVPISIVAVGADELQKRQITRLDDLSAVVPDLGILNRGNIQYVEIRGISNITGGGGSLVGFYIDEADVTLGGSLNTQINPVIYDLERVEVLRGPQGTLYGEGSAGGTVRLITRNPNLDRFALDSQVTALFTEGGGPSQRINAMANVPLVESQLGVRVAGTFEHDGGWIDQPAANQTHINWQDLTNVRLKGLWQPDPRFTASTMVIINRDNHSPNTSDVASPSAFTAPFHLTVTPRESNDYNLYNLTLAYDLPDAIRILNSASYLKESAVRLNQGSFSQLPQPPKAPYGYYSPFQDIEDRILTDELRLTSTGSGPFQWTLGGFYRRYTDFNNNPVNYYALPGPPGAPLPASFATGSDVLYKSWSTFADASYTLAKRFTVGAGARYFRQDQDFVNLVSRTRQTGAFHSTDPRVYAQFAPTPGANVYASAAKGFRSGGFNSVGNKPMYGPENIWTYELGTKLELLHGRVNIDTALFRSDYANYQALAVPVGSASGYFFNVSRARIKGIESDLTWSPLPQWRLDVRGDYLNARFIEVNAASGPFVVGDPIEYVPRYQVAISAQHDFSLAGKHGFMRLDYSQQGPMETKNRTIGPWYSGESDIIRLLNFNAGLYVRDNLQLGFIAQNLRNDQGFLGPYSHILGGDVRSRPRTYGVDVTMTFN